MRALFIHQNFPGQFRHVASALAQNKGVEVVALTDAANQKQLPGVKIWRYKSPAAPPKDVGTSTQALLHRYLRGERVAAALGELRRRGLNPDVIVGHPGWGELLLVREMFPDCPLIAHAEYYYAVEGGDIGFDPEFPDLGDQVRFGLKAKNLPLLSALVDCDHAIAPTAWQASRFPAVVASKIETIHEGIRTDLVTPNPAARFELGSGQPPIRSGDEIITFVNRNLEPMRGFHIFMRALPAILQARPEARVVIVGGDGVSYGRPPMGGGTWKDAMLAELGDALPTQRVHFVGQIPYPAFIALMQITTLHIYATYPFVLSWSMLEAMSAGALVLGSATAPVTEMIRHGHNGLLFDFFDRQSLVKQAIAALSEPARHQQLRTNARATIVDRYDLATTCLPAWLASIETLAAKRRTGVTSP